MYKEHNESLQISFHLYNGKLHCHVICACLANIVPLYLQMFQLLLSIWGIFFFSLAIYSQKAILKIKC
jgi:hypothetical protein